MMSDWASRLKYDPIRPLTGSDAIEYFTRRDLLGLDAGPIERIHQLPDVARIVRKQRPDGSWKYPGRTTCNGVKYSLLETWKQLRFLVDQYGMGRPHMAIVKSAEYVFARQTGEGDIRGILANQYAPYYTGAIMSLLIKAGYGDDPRIEKGLRWLLNVRQEDGGWIIGSPGILGLGKLTRAELEGLVSDPGRKTARAFDPSKPFSAAGTGMVLRAFAAHPRYRKSPEAMRAARLLKSMLFKKDNWSSYGHPDNWVRFQFPFWWTNLVSALDTLSLMGFTAGDDDVRNALEWLIRHQRPDGLWNVSYSRIHRSPDKPATRLWVSLAICRILKRCYG
ncbi:MAG TPA: prenyltransferase/squalene oxidase repeat-containing protein [Methanocella sp.]|uniref:prenyltransferase/squalene oxidase repeat-containing protein n=1 Tax=Methanocella sp. TaxID=2052833 RepID=UPI002BEC48AD|nr:prenyltransferase/squalene oxidase repeat-containing protein [Methanocella sp.]HTY90121.1 prenyltransferase/squalene oxidase repeat-containing protein [Methanocella sp.]